MPYSPGSIRVDPNGQTAVVTFTLPGGGTPVAYDSRTGAGTVSLPASVSAATTFWFQEATQVTVSALVGGVQQATASGTTANVDLSGGGQANITVALPAASGGSATSQPLDSDLTTIAALDSTVAGVLASTGSGWVSRTYAQIKTSLGLVKADVGLGNVDNTSDVNKPVSTAQATADALALAKASNLSDLASAATARTNLGLGGAATLAVGTTTGTVAAGDDPRIAAAQSATGLYLAATYR